MCLARFGSPATACVDQAEDLSPQSSPFRDAWIGKNVRNKRVSDRVLFPSPAPAHFRIPLRVRVPLARAADNGFRGAPQWPYLTSCLLRTMPARVVAAARRRSGFRTGNERKDRVGLA